MKKLSLSLLLLTATHFYADDNVTQPEQENAQSITWQAKTPISPTQMAHIMITNITQMFYINTSSLAALVAQYKEKGFDKIMSENPFPSVIFSDISNLSSLPQDIQHQRDAFLTASKKANDLCFEYAEQLLQAKESDYKTLQNKYMKQLSHIYTHVFSVLHCTNLRESEEKIKEVETAIENHQQAYATQQRLNAYYAQQAASEQPQNESQN